MIKLKTVLITSISILLWTRVRRLSTVIRNDTIWYDSADLCELVMKFGEKNLQRLIAEL